MPTRAMPDATIDVPTPFAVTPFAVEQTIVGVRQRVAAARAEGGSIGLVPTMGALHAGHLSLIEEARRRCGYVVVSIFVNPTQFGPHEDFDRYPRTLDADLTACQTTGADLVFLPSKSEMYPSGYATFVEPTGLANVLEGAIRPGHFRGVATVVLKLFNIVMPDVAFFGAKDYQQQLIIRQMVCDLNLPLEIATLPTVREPDGLAMSSRNRYLETTAREQARAISQALFAARDALVAGAEVAAVVAEMRRLMESAGLAVDYAVACDAETLEVLTARRPKMVLLVAARLGNVRLIDNVEVTVVDQAPT
jgi:pantoate--beta-alanine ligase